MKVKRAELKQALKAAMEEHLDWNDINDIVPLEEVMRAVNCGVSEPGDVIPVPMEELEFFLEGKPPENVLLMGIQSERFVSGEVRDGANLNDEFFATGRLGYFASIPEAEVASWMGSFLEPAYVLDYAGDDDLEALAELYGIEVENED